jgi:hypothetical protein
VFLIKATEQGTISTYKQHKDKTSCLPEKIPETRIKNGRKKPFALKFPVLNDFLDPINKRVS